MKVHEMCFIMWRSLPIALHHYGSLHYTCTISTHQHSSYIIITHQHTSHIIITHQHPHTHHYIYHILTHIRYHIITHQIHHHTSSHIPHLTHITYTTSSHTNTPSHTITQPKLPHTHRILTQYIHNNHLHTLPDDHSK